MNIANSAILLSIKSCVNKPEAPVQSRSLSGNWKGPRSWLGRGRCKAARRRRCRCTSSRSPNEADAPSKPEPKGRMGVARRSLRCSSSTMCMDIASSSRLALAVQAPCARPLRILRQAPNARLSLRRCNAGHAHQAKETCPARCKRGTISNFGDV